MSYLWIVSMRLNARCASSHTQNPCHVYGYTLPARVRVAVHMRRSSFASSRERMLYHVPHIVHMDVWKSAHTGRASRREPLSYLVYEQATTSFRISFAPRTKCSDLSFLGVAGLQPPRKSALALFPSAAIALYWPFGVTAQPNATRYKSFYVWYNIDTGPAAIKTRTKRNTDTVRSQWATFFAHKLWQLVPVRLRSISMRCAFLADASAYSSGAGQL